MKTNPICVALDCSDADTIESLARAVEPYVGVFKIGTTAFTGCGPDLVRRLGTRKPTFVDLKLHDIPAQVEGAVAEIAGLGAAYTTVHALGGRAMVRAAVGAAGPELAVLAVTVLTSLADADLARLGVAGPAPAAVLRLGAGALEAGARGLVCSPHEVGLLRAEFGPRGAGGPILVVPGIRPAGSTTDDQARTLDGRAALAAGADLIVVGRPITAAPDPGRAAAAMMEEAGT